MIQYLGKRSISKCKNSNGYISGLPGKPVLVYKDYGKNTFILEMNMWFGNPGVYWKLYENDIVIYEGCLDAINSRPQRAAVTIECRCEGIYNYTCELINCYGSSYSKNLTVNLSKQSIWYPYNLKVTPYDGNLIVVTWDKVCCAKSYDLQIDDEVIEDVSSPYFFEPENSSVYSFRIRSRGAESISRWSNIVQGTNILNWQKSMPHKLLVGYWLNSFEKSKGVKLRDVSLDFDIILVSFAESDEDYSTVKFLPNNETKEEFIEDIKYLQSKGKKVCISLGGQNEYLILQTKEAEDRFVNSITNIIDTYGFDGVDMALQGGTISLNLDDNDFKNPKTPKIVHLISAMKRLTGAYGDDFILTMAPEITSVQGGMSAYGGIWGAYLPIIYALSEQLTLLHGQAFNTGNTMALDGVSYSQGTADFHVAMEEMLLNGFPVCNDNRNMFPALPQDKISLTLPISSNYKENGYISSPEFMKIFNYLITGQSFGGNYIIKNSKGYKNLRAITIWNINSDLDNNFELTNKYRCYLNNLPE